tara:strand:+ start:11653 stop:12099 length:447 start_codon:yes stop_codon:yes gene_type:complete
MQEFNRFLETDTNYQLILTRHQKVHTEVRSLSFEIMREARKINGLLMSFDLMIEKLCQHECVEEGDSRDKDLLLLTANDSDGWYGTINMTLDMIRDQIVEQCNQVVLAKHNYEKAKESASHHCTSLSAARDEAEKRFKKQQADKAKKQ